MDSTQTTLKNFGRPIEEIPLTYSITALPALMRRVQKLANQKHDGNRSKMVIELVEKGLEAESAPER